MNKLYVAILCNLLFALHALAATSLWVVKTEQTTTYLGGTCHVLRPSDFPLPGEYAAAYAEAAAVIFEADPAALGSPELKQRLLAQAVYPAGQSLEQELSPETWRLLGDYCRRHGVSLAAVSRLRPAMAALTLLAARLEELGATRKGVDDTFYARAVADRKRTGELESAGEQMAFLFAMGEGYEDEFIRQSLDDLDSGEETFLRMIAAWRRGDEAALDELLIADLRREFPDVYRKLLLERNARWLPQVERFIQSPETELILVGVGHLVGEEGLLAALRRRGYRVQQVR
jgi:hypothetical protein